LKRITNQTSNSIFIIIKANPNIITYQLESEIVMCYHQARCLA
jgi:hypothetical protein